MTSVRYFPRSGLVMLRGRDVTTTFRASDRHAVNHMLDWLGYQRIYAWSVHGDCHEGHTARQKNTQEVAA